MSSDPLIGQCARCGGSLTMGHSCGLVRDLMPLQGSTDDSRTKLAQMIRLWLAANGIEQAELAKIWGTTPATVSRLLNGKGIPDGKTVAKLIAWMFEP